MSKLAKGTHVYIPCPACGKTERVKLKWAENHKTLKCRRCRERVDLRHNPAQSLIARTAAVVTTFEKALDMLHAEAKKDAKMAKVHNAVAKKGQKKQPRRQTVTKRKATLVVRTTDVAPTSTPMESATTH